MTTSAWVLKNRLVIGAKSLAGVERQLLEQERVVGERLAGQDADGVAVGRRVGAGARADVGGAAGAVLHDQRLTPALVQLVAEDAGDDVGGAAGPDRHDRPDRTASG